MVAKQGLICADRYGGIHTIDLLFDYLIFFQVMLECPKLEISKRYSSYKLQPKLLKLVLNFPPSGPHKIGWGFLKF